MGRVIMDVPLLGNFSGVSRCEMALISIEEGGFLMSFTVYVLRSKSTSKIYIGQTSNLAHRLEQHNNPEDRKSLYTKRNRGPWEVVYQECCSSRSEAMRREKALKSGQGRTWLHEEVLCKLK